MCNIDLHSYSDAMVKKLFLKDNNTDICIGVDNNFTPNKLIEMSIEHFKKWGYSVKISDMMKVQ